jgi:hypothetical protein
MFSRPFQAVAAISSSSAISTEPCETHAFFAFGRIEGHPLEQGGLPGLAQGSGRFTVAMVAVSGHSFSVPATSSATSDSSTPMAAGPMLALSANRVSVCAVVRGVVAPEQQGHQQADADAEQQAQHEPGGGELGPRMLPV